MTFDEISKSTIMKLEEHFSVKSANVISITSECSIGIEIEVKFRYMFPDLYKKWFINKKYIDYSEEEKQIFCAEVSLAEKNILNKLEKTNPLGIPKGLDKYWEFAFTPVHDISLIIKQILILKELNLLPSGRHSLHITVAGQSANTKIYWLLSYLELLFIDKARIIEGFSKIYTKSSDTWAKKGYGGICTKNQYDLVNSDLGFEMRTLYIDDNTDIIKLFTILVKGINSIVKGEDFIIMNKLVTEFEKRNLPNKNWEKPHMNPDIWNRFIENFDELKDFAQFI